MSVVMLLMEDFNCESISMSKVSVASIHFNYMGRAINRNVNGDLIMLIIRVPNEVKEVVGACNKLSGLSKNSVGVVVGMEDGVDVCDIAADKGNSTFRDMWLDLRSTKHSTRYVYKY